MILNSKNNQFVFRFPKGFIFPEIEEKYNFYLKRLPTPFENITDYINNTVQSVTFPSVASDEVEQWVGRKVTVDGKNIGKNPQYWRQSLDLDRVIPKEFTVSMKAADGYINYWALFENYRHYLTITDTTDYVPDMNIIYLDRDGYELITIGFKEPLIKSISDVEMNYSQTAMEFRVFSMTFKYNRFDINVKLD